MTKTLAVKQQWQIAENCLQCYLPDYLNYLHWDFRYEVLKTQDF